MAACIEAGADAISIDGLVGGTGCSPDLVTQGVGIPTIACIPPAVQALKDYGVHHKVILIALGGIRNGLDAFKALAMGAPFVKAVCMGRALMIPGMVGKNIRQWLDDGKLPNTVNQFGSTVEEIFINYEDVKNIVGAGEIENIPLGAIGIYSYSEKIKVGLQQLMAGARCFSVPAITRRELISLTEECARVTGIPYLMEAYREEAMEVLG